MGIEYENDKLDELLRLTKENNKMLHAMRRSAWLGGIFRLISWIALVIIPLWLYMQFIAPVMQSMLQTYEQIQGSSASAQAQLTQMGDYISQFKSFFGTGN